MSRSSMKVLLGCGAGLQSLNPVLSIKFLSCVPGPALVMFRCVHTQPITTNMRYISNDYLDLKTDERTLKLETPVERPMCVMLGWMGSKQRHLLKYAEVYLQMGLDVLTVSCTPGQLMWPVRGSQVVAANLLKFLEHNDHRPLVVHGFSVGAYVWAELLVHSLKDLQRYQPVLDKVAAQVWDSPADVEELPVGLPLSLFPNNKILQKALTAYAKTHMWLFYQVATQHYWRATRAYHEPPCRAPSLFLVSRADPVGAANRSQRARATMTAMGIKCNWQCWADSPHVQHFSWHRADYLRALYSHLEQCGLLRTDHGKLASVLQ